MDIEDEATSKVRIEWVKVQYDYIPKYCKECKLQGHNEEACWRFHMELFVQSEKDKQNTNAKGDANNNTKNPIMILSSGKVVGNV